MIARRWMLKKGRNTKRGLVRLIVGGRPRRRLGDQAEHDLVPRTGFVSFLDSVFIGLLKRRRE